MDKAWDIFGIGTSAVDELLFVERFPLADEKLAVRERQRQGGGQTATALVAAARHGAKTAFCARLGADELSAFVVDGLSREGVDCSPVVRTEGGSPYYAAIIVDQSTGSRTILYDGAAVRPVEPGWIRAEWIARSRVVFFDENAADAGLEMARLAHAAGVPVVADLEDKPDRPLEALAAAADHLIVGLAFARRFTGETEVEKIVSALARINGGGTRVLGTRVRGERVHRPKMVVLTGGGAGCWYAEGGGSLAYSGPLYHLDAVSEGPLVDTTGCGDVFHGAYAAALARGECPARAVTIANATAGLKTAQPGGRAGIPDLARVEAVLARAAPAQTRA